MSEDRQRVYTKDIILILGASFFYMAGPMLVTPLIAGFSKDLGATGVIMGIMGGIMNLVSLVCRPIVGNLTDRISKYRFASVGALLMIAAAVGYVTAPNTIVLLIARIVNGVGFSCCSVCLSTWMCDLLPKDKIGSGMGIYGTMNALAMALAPALSVSIYRKIGYRRTFVLAVICMVLTFALVQFVKDKGVPVNTVGGTRKHFGKLIEVKALPIALIIMLFAIPYCATQSFLVSYVEARSIPVRVSLFFPMYAVILLILRFSMKSKFDQWGFGVFFKAGCVSAFISLLSLTFLNGNVLMAAAAVFMAGGYGIMCSVSQATSVLLASPGNRGVANSTYYVGLDLGMALGPFLGGILYDAVPVSRFYPVLMICVPVSIAVYVIWQVINRRKSKEVLQ